MVTTPLDPGDANSEYSILSRLGLPVTANTALEVKSTNSSTFYVTGSMQPHYSVSANHEPAYSEVAGGTAGPHLGILHPQVCSTTSALYPYTTVNNNNVYSTSPIMNQIQHVQLPQQYFTGQAVQGSNAQMVPPYHHPPSARYELASNQRYSASQRKQLALGLQGLALANQNIAQGQTQGQSQGQGQVQTQGQGQGQIYSNQYQKAVPVQNQATASQRQTQTTSRLRHSQEVPLRQKPKTQLPVRPKSAEPRYPLTLESHHYTAAPNGQDLPTPPEYPGVAQVVTQVKAAKDNKELRHSCEMLERLTQTYSQPDLTRLAELQLYAQAPTGRGDAQQCQQPAAAGRGDVQHMQQPSPRQQQQMQLHHQQQQQQQQLVKQQQAKQASPTQSPQKKAELDHAAVATRATQMVERLSEENRSLRKELEGYYNKTCKLQKLEQEIKKLSDAYENLVKHSQKREALDRVMRFKLDAERKKLHETNKELQDQLDRSLTQLSQKEIYNMDDSELKKEVQSKDSMISKLISHNREISAVREQLEREVSSQRSTLQEQKAHIEILDNALGNAQSSVAKFEEETLRRRLQEQRLQEMQEALSQLQLATEQREAIGHKLRSKLEEEIRLLKNQQATANKTSDTDEGISSDSESPTSIQSLVQQMQEKEQRVLELESDILKWEQKFLEETAIRQLAVDAASTPKDARIAALEQGSAETEKILAEARTERLKHLEEVYQANRKAAQLEAKVRTLQAQIAEKDAMIKVLQRHSSLSRTSSVSSLFGSPIHSPRPSIISPFSMVSPLSMSGSMPPSGVSSRQNSQLAQLPLHSKSNSTGSPAVPQGGASGAAIVTTTSNHSNQGYKVLRDLQHKLAAQQAAFLSGVDSESEEVKKCLWQV